MSIIYIASSLTNNWQNLKKVQLLTDLLERNHTVIQSWSRSEDNGAKEAAERDLREIDLADTLVLLTEGSEDFPNSGMHFEAGYAIAKGKNVIVIGPRVNIFYKLDAISYWDSFNEFRRAILQEKKEQYVISKS